MTAGIDYETRRLVHALLKERGPLRHTDADLDVDLAVRRALGLLSR